MGPLLSVAALGVPADLHVDALTKVSTFSSSLRQAQVLPACASLKTLHTLTLCIMPSPGEESLRTRGARLVHASPHLTSMPLPQRLRRAHDDTPPRASARGVDPYQP